MRTISIVVAPAFLLSSCLVQADWEFSSTDQYLFARQQSDKGDVLTNHCSRSFFAECNWTLLLLKSCKLGQQVLVNFQGNNQIQTKATCNGLVDIDGVEFYHYEMLDDRHLNLVSLKGHTKVTLIDSPYVIYETVFNLTNIHKVAKALKESATSRGEE